MVFKNVWPSTKFGGIALASTKGTGVLFFPKVCNAVSDTSLIIPHPTPTTEAQTPQPSFQSLNPPFSPARRGSWKILSSGLQPREASLISLGECSAERKAGRGVLWRQGEIQEGGRKVSDIKISLATLRDWRKKLGINKTLTSDRKSEVAVGKKSETY